MDDLSWQIVVPGRRASADRRSGYRLADRGVYARRLPPKDERASADLDPGERASSGRSLRPVLAGVPDATLVFGQVRV
jgi:hypothetical protein